MSRLTPGHLDWTPESGMRTIAGQVVEVVGTEIQLVALLRDGRRITYLEAKEMMGACSSVDNLRKAAADFRQLA